jgi:guanylate kinase
MKRLTRKELPAYGKINKTVDIERLRQYCVENGYIDYDQFTDIQYSADSKHKAFLVANTFCKDTFFKEDDAPSREGEKYKQLYLTDIDPNSKVNTEDRLNETHSSIFVRTRRLDPNSSDYIPEADEYNYTHRNHHVKDIFEEILDMFTSQVTRVRLAVIMPGFTIKPHVDYDPSYITRYHIPVITNDDVIFGHKTKEGNQEYKMPADGSIYFFNSGIVHWVSNNGNEPRLHMIIDTNGQDDLFLL